MARRVKCVVKASGNYLCVYMCVRELYACVCVSLWMGTHGTHVEGQPGMLGLTSRLVSDMVSLKFMAIYVKLPGLVAISHFSTAGPEIQKYCCI